jgi:hypothetical protein
MGFGSVGLDSAAHAQETATVLPKHISRMRGISVLGLPVTHTFNNDGNLNEAMEPLNISLPAAQQAASSPDLKRLYDGLNNFEPGLGDSLFQTDFYAQGQVSFQRYIFAYEHGLTDRISIGAIVPVVSYTTRTSFNTSVYSNAAAVKERVRGIQPLEDGVDQFAKSLPTPDEYNAKLFTSRGYKIPGYASSTGLGDMEVGAKYQFYHSDEILSAVQAGFRLPSATHSKDYSNLLDQASGDGQTDFGVLGIAQYMPTSDTTLEASAKITLQLADAENMPVRFAGQSELPDLNNPQQWDRVQRDLGDMFDSDLSITQTWLNKSLTTYAVYQYELKAQDMYSGRAGFDYHSLMANTRSEAHHYELGVGYSTIQLFREKKFAIPLETRIAVNDVFYGINTPDTTYARVDLILYF